MTTNRIYKSISCICLLSLVIGLSSCDEQKRIIVPFVPAGNRVVLLEEFTGKGCTNCPKGSREIENLLTIFPNNLVPVSLHAGFFANPAVFQVGQYDLRTPEGEALYSYIGAPFGYPSGVIDRTPFGGEMQLSANQWSSAISAAIQEEPAIELSIQRTYDTASRLLTVTVNGIGKENVTGDIRVSVMITESGIIDAQDDLEAGGIVPNYVHNHVLRGMLTPATGTSILNGISIGQSFSETYTRVLDTNWDAQNMDIVAFISDVVGNNFPVLQAAQVKLIP